MVNFNPHNIYNIKSDVSKKNLKVSKLQEYFEPELKKLEDEGSPLAIQKYFGDCNLLIRRVGPKELAETPEAEVI